MVLWRIELSDLVPGDPLPWDLYGADRASGPLLRKGQMVSDRAQLGRWLDAGLFAGADARPSVLHLINASNKRLDQLLRDLPNKDNAERELRDIARNVVHAVELNADIALACIFLSQIGGTYAVRHCIETALVAVVVARGLQKTHEETLVISAAALTMNVGMLRHHDSFQDRRGALTREEMEIVHRHPEQSAGLLKCAGISDEEWISCVMLHHEKDDGSGYPDGKTGADIPRNARLIGLADRYCAQVSARNYRRSILPDQALRHILQDNAVDPLLSEQFVKQLGKYPPGSLVRLQNGEIGVVTQRNENGGGIHVHALRDAAGTNIAAAPLPSSAWRSTGEPGYAIAEALHEDQAEVRFCMQQVWGDQARL